MLHKCVNGVFIFIVASITRAQDDVSACRGTDVTLNWSYNREEDLLKAFWFKNGKSIMTMTSSSPAEPATEVANIQHVSNGQIRIQTVSLADAGEYKLTVLYKSGLRIDTDRVNVTVMSKLL